LDAATRNIKPGRDGDLSLSLTDRGAEAALGYRLSRAHDLTAAAYAGRHWSGEWTYGTRLRWSFGGSR
jgi:hypothetical protein